MLDSEGIAGKRFLKFESVVELLKEEKEKGVMLPNPNSKLKNKIKIKK